MKWYCGTGHKMVFFLRIVYKYCENDSNTNVSQMSQAGRTAAA